MENTAKTVLFLGLLTGLLIGIGSFWGYTGIAIGLIFAVLINFFSYFFSDKIALMMYRAKPVTKKEQPDLYKMIREVVQLANIPMPRVYLIPTSTPNAFATGRSPKHAAVAVTEGLINLMEKDELKAVIAHEISHVKNRDILIASIAATIAGVISYIGMMARFSTIFSGERDGNNNIISLLILGILTPIMALIIQLAISRSREYQADESAAKLLHNPHSMIKALEKLESGVKHDPMRFGSEAGASMFIVNPFSAKNFFKLLSTHPSTEDRIHRLKSLRI